MIAILYRYLMIIVACIALLLGLQIPNFVDQYEKRVDAHLREVTVNLQPFQDIANRYFSGDLNSSSSCTATAAKSPSRKKAQRSRRWCSASCASRPTWPRCRPACR